MIAIRIIMITIRVMIIVMYCITYDIVPGEGVRQKGYAFQVTVLDIVISRSLSLSIYIYIENNDCYSYNYDYYSRYDNSYVLYYV